MLKSHWSRTLQQTAVLLCLGLNLHAGPAWADAAQLTDLETWARTSAPSVRLAQAEKDVAAHRADAARARQGGRLFGGATVGNARETAEWAKSKGYKSLIVVTADYHMPRSMLELRATMPDATLHPYPVKTDLNARRWWKTSLSARRMIVEYCKYLAILGREAFLGLGPKDKAAPAADPRDVAYLAAQAQVLSQWRAQAGHPSDNAALQSRLTQVRTRVYAASAPAP